MASVCSLRQNEILSKENGASIRLLAKQKAFNTCVPTIAQDFRKADTAIKPNYLIALSGILKHMPTEVIVSEIDTLLPLLLQSLDLEDSDVKSCHNPKSHNHKSRKSQSRRRTHGQSRHPTSQIRFRSQDEHGKRTA